MIDFDPFDPSSFRDPYPAYAVLRDEQPVYRREIPDHRVWPHYWMLTRADDVNDALSDWRTFSSARGTLVDTDITLIPPNMFNMDPPRHDELRTLDLDQDSITNLFLEVFSVNAHSFQAAVILDSPTDPIFEGLI